VSGRKEPISSCIAESYGFWQLRVNKDFWRRGDDHDGCRGCVSKGGNYLSFSLGSKILDV